MQFNSATANNLPTNLETGSSITNSLINNNASSLINTPAKTVLNQNLTQTLNQDTNQNALPNSATAAFTQNNLNLMGLMNNNNSSTSSSNSNLFSNGKS